MDEILQTFGCSKNSGHIDATVLKIQGKVLLHSDLFPELIWTQEGKCKSNTFRESNPVHPTRKEWHYGLVYPKSTIIFIVKVAKFCWLLYHSDNNMQHLFQHSHNPRTWTTYVVWFVSEKISNITSFPNL